jgi:nucleotide-binding universal stress UspA family protein
MRSILLATDGSAGADRAAEVAATLAKGLGGSLLILTVGGSLSPDQVKELARAEGNAGDALEALSHQVLAHAKQCAERAGVSDVRTEAGWGDPPDTPPAIMTSISRPEGSHTVAPTSVGSTVSLPRGV